jgi:DNA-directed RNA polymerase sigma subunit (sigma70/sigma32)
MLNTPVPPGLPPGTNMLLVSVARRYRGRGLNLAELVEAGKDGWQRAHRYFGADTDKFERWGLLWVKESMLMTLYDNENKAGLPS